jgi:hypothetical protein
MNLNATLIVTAGIAGGIGAAVVGVARLVGVAARVAVIGVAAARGAFVPPTRQPCPAIEGSGFR